MKHILKAVAGACAALAVSAAPAATFNFDGTITHHTDVVQIAFTLNSAATDVKVWTDSFDSAVNFDPITAVWRAEGGGFTLVDQNDDNDEIAPGQTWFDSGLEFDTLAAGDYLFTIAVFDNFAPGPTLADGFDFEGETPMTLAEYYNGPRGGYWSVHLDGVDGASNPTSPIPEPSTYALMLAGLGVVGTIARRRRQG